MLAVRRSGAMTKLTILALVVLLVVAGSFGLYYFTLPTSGGNSQTVSRSTSSNSTVDTTKYLGYLPLGYVAAAHYPNSPTFPCPAGMAASDCKLFQSTCGNGVCDPNERCDTCPIDCVVTGQLVCDPYSGRAGAPATVCQAIQDRGGYG